MDEAKNRQSVDFYQFYQYFKSIRQECPWSYSAFVHGRIDIQPWQGQALPLGSYEARVYLVDLAPEPLEQLCQSLDHGVDTWLFSYPGYGPYATPRSVLIQQDRQNLDQIRSRLNNDT